MESKRTIQTDINILNEVFVQSSGFKMSLAVASVQEY